MVDFNDFYRLLAKNRFLLIFINMQLFNLHIRILYKKAMI